MKKEDRQQKPRKAKRGARRRPRGRPHGTFKRFLNDPDRFALATLACMTVGYDFGPYEAAARVVLLFSDEPIKLHSIEDIAVQASVRLRHASMKGRIGTLVTKLQVLEGSLDPIETDWLSTSIDALVILENTIHYPNPVDMHRALNTLTAYGWGPILKRIAGKIKEAFQTNMPPVDEPLSRVVKAMLIELRENH